MRIVVMLSVLCVFLFADGTLDRLYGSGDYVKACEHASVTWRDNEKDEKFMIMFGNACMKADYIDYLAVPAVRLGKSKQAREASALYATLVTKKRLLLMALIDGVDLSGLALPQAPHILSVAFDKMVAKDLEYKDGKWVDKGGAFSVSVINSPKESGLKTILIQETDGTKRIMFK